jgi:hypothetical protein
MSPVDPRLNTLRTRALMWDRSLDWFDEPAEISLEIIPPTHWRDPSDLAAMGGAPAAALGLACPPSDARTETRGRDAASECRALAILAAALIHAVHGR